MGKGKNVKNYNLKKDLEEYVNIYGFPTVYSFGNGNLKSIYCYRQHFNKWYISDILKECGIFFSELDKIKMDHDKNGKIFGASVSKEYCTDVIYKLASKLNRSLKYDDFRNADYINTIPIHLINKYWGSLNKMKASLYLEIIQENMFDRKTNLKNIKIDIFKVCNDIFKLEGRKIITSSDLQKYGKYSLATYRKYLKKSDFTLGEYIKSIGFKTNDIGRGFNYLYKDNERVFSKFEYNVSNFLRSKGLIYNKDYFRNVKYSIFLDDYEGNMDCDYKINIFDQIYYIEIAGFLNNYKYHYTNDIPLRNKSKNKYALKLKEKENLLFKNKLNYMIVIPENKYLEYYIHEVNEFIFNNFKIK